MKKENDHGPTSMPAMTEVALLHYPGSQLASILTIEDLFSVANEIARKNGADTDDLIRVSHWQENESHNIVCVLDTSPGASHDLQFVIVPPSSISIARPQPIKAHAHWLFHEHAHGATIVSICAGTIIAAESGIIDGRLVAAHWALAELLRTHYPKVRFTTDTTFLDDGDIITSTGWSLWRVGLNLIARMLGSTVMLETAQLLVLDPPIEDYSQYRMFAPKMHHGDEAILKVQHWLQSHPQDVNAAEMAAIAGLSSRTFFRRFFKATGMRPVVYVQHLRVRKAREMLEFTQRSVDEIAWLVGYKDASAFSRVFQRQIGLPPGEYRLKMQRTSSARVCE